MSLVSSGSSEISRKMSQPDNSSDITRNSEMTKLSGHTSNLTPVYECSPNDHRSIDEVSYGFGVEGE